MLLPFCISLLLLEAKIFFSSACQTKIPYNARKLVVYTEVYGWSQPKNNYNGPTQSLPEGETIEFTCDTGFLDDRLPGKTYTFFCEDGIYNKTYHYEDLLCKSDFHQNTKTYTISNVQLGSDIFKCENPNWEVYQVGVVRPDGSFIPTYRVCYDKHIMEPKFVFQPRLERKWIYEKDLEGRYDIWGFDKFGTTTLERVKLSDGYVTKKQTYRLTSEMPGRYSFQNPYPHVFSRGHLATFAHYMSPAERNTTCLYINAVPQWKELNKHMWTVIEAEIRALNERDPYGWEVYTGSYGRILTRHRQPLLLSPFPDQTGKITRACIPVPKVIWKFVRNLHDERHSRVYVGINNPRFQSARDISKDYFICKPKTIRGQMVRGSNTKGFVYECHVKELLVKLSKEGIIKM